MISSPSNNANMPTSRQIRPPIYSLKQSKLRKRRVVRFAILYFTILVIFVVIIAAPVVLRNTKVLDSFLKDSLWNAIGVPDTNHIGLLQPLDHGINDTVDWYTGSNLPGGYSSASAPTPAAGTDRWYI